MFVQINQFGIDLIKTYEGFSATVYKDVAGKLTIGFGHLLRQGENLTSITEEQAEIILRQDLATAEYAVSRLVTAPLNGNQFSALVCFVYNLGEGTFAGSTLLKCLNARQFDDVPGEILRWHRSGKTPVKGLVRRRAAEAVLFLT